MHLFGSETFAAPREQVWAFLIDPMRFSPCSPAPITRIDDRHYRAQARLGSGLFSATVVVDLEVVEVEALEVVRMVARGGASGTAINATTTFTLRDGPDDGTDAGSTVVEWSSELTMTGLFAAAGLKLIAEKTPQAMAELTECVRPLIEA